MELRTEAVVATLEMSELKSREDDPSDSSEYESLPSHASLTTHMTAGAVAGILEHTVMYPIDSVKVRRRHMFTINSHCHIGFITSNATVRYQQRLMKSLDGSKFSQMCQLASVLSNVSPVVSMRRCPTALANVVQTSPVLLINPSCLNRPEC